MYNPKMRDFGPGVAIIHIRELLNGVLLQSGYVIHEYNIVYALRVEFPPRVVFLVTFLPCFEFLVTFTPAVLDTLSAFVAFFAVADALACFAVTAFLPFLDALPLAAGSSSSELSSSHTHHSAVLYLLFGIAVRVLRLSAIGSKSRVACFGGV